MALSDYEKHLVFEVLGIPNATLTPYSQGSEVARAELEGRLATLGAAQEERLLELLTEWKTISTSSTRLQAMASNDGVEIDHRRQRRLVRERVHAIVPVSFSESRLGERGAVLIG